MIELLADRGIILCRLQDGIVFIDGEALVGNRLLQGAVRLVANALFVGRRRFRNFAFIALLDAGYLPDGHGSRYARESNPDARITACRTPVPVAPMK